MIIYQGSPVKVTRPLLELGKKNNDYGQGFYCTPSKDMAREWAVGADHNGYANSYSLDLTDLNVLNLNAEEYTILHWLTILIENRTFSFKSPLSREAAEYLKKEFFIDYRQYDVITGYRADDSYFAFAQDFLNGTISISQLSYAMRLGDLGTQIVLKKQKAFDKLKFISAEPVYKEEWYLKREQRDKRARKLYFSQDRDSYVRGSVYITKILDEEIKADDPRIR
ncbi:MAG: DUF3990 domain-containing protein [Eubacteriales bacterium]|nr:DUF3990 domain-containing protein [Eubacteriales bacterium]